MTEQNISLEISRYNFWKLMTEYKKTEIPIIQRDYAQGRKDDKAKDVREGLLSSVFKSLTTGQPIDFDFIYGYIKDDKFFPLDGQQRLTTLFLLHWYLANKEGFRQEATETLLKFTYETRTSTRDFCNYLVSNDINPAGYGKFSEAVVDSAWFYSEWTYDPSIKSMLRMLDAIHHKFDKVQTLLFEKLKGENIISFMFLEIDKFGLSDDLYIKMNARGKALTDFENFKAKFGQFIELNHPDKMDEFSKKIDGEWADLFWPFRSDSKKCPVIDFAFMRFFYFITEMMFFKSGLKEGDDEKTPFVFNSDNNPIIDFKLIEATYAFNENVNFLFSVFNLLSKIENIDDLFASLYYQKQDEDNIGKVKLFDDNKLLSIFSRCVSDSTSEFDLIHKILLFSQLNFMVRIEGTKNLADCLRVIRNLLSSRRLEYKFLTNQLNNIDLLLTNDIHELLIDEKLNVTGFSPEQLSEEKFKAKLIIHNIANKKLLYHAEDIKILKCSVRVLLIASYSTIENFKLSSKLSEFKTEDFSPDFFINLSSSYESFSFDEFRCIWGDLMIHQDVFHMEVWRSRMTYNKNYHISESILKFLMKKSLTENLTLSTETFIVKQEREFIQSLLIETTDLSMVKEIRKQLYLYYIFTRRIIKRDFFQDNRWNIGWTKHSIGFRSLFSAGVIEDERFKEHNPVFQLYREAFAENSNYILGVEQVGNRDHRGSIFQELEEWSMLKN